MKNPIVIRLIPLLLLVTTALAEGEARKDVVIRRGTVRGEGPQHAFRMERGGPLEMEKVAYLGVETMPVDPTMAAQLGLARGTGLVVRRVAEGSPAEGLLQPHDILTKLDDQILVNMAQLSVLVRNRKAGDQIKLSYIRAGKEATASAQLGEREVPKLAWQGAMGVPAVQVFGHGAPMAGSGGIAFSQAMPGAPGVHGFHSTPAIPATEAGDVMRVIGGDRQNWFAHPRVHVLRRAGGMGSTILDLAAGNFVFSDEQGSVEVNASGDKRELTVKDHDGKVTFQGPINTPEEHAKLPAEVRARIEAIGGAEIGTDAQEIKIETKVLEPASQIRFKLTEPAEAEEIRVEPGLRTL
jgi:serine protease Do